MYLQREPQGSFGEVNDAGLHDQQEPHVYHYLRKSLEPITTKGERVFGAPVADVGEPLDPELRAFTAAPCTETENIFLTLQGYLDG